MFKRWGLIVFLFLATLLPAGAQVFEPDTLDAAVVRADDSYIRAFLKKLDRSLAANDPDNAEDWRSRVYTKIELDVDNMERMLEDGILHGPLGFVMEYADTSSGNTYVPALFSESISELYHSQSPSFNREEMQASRISGIDAGNALQQFTGSYILKTSFYKPSISIYNLSLPNPAVASSQVLYNYFLVDSLQVEGHKTYVLRFHPKKLVTSPVLDGEMWIDAEDFGIRSVRASLSAKSDVNWIRRFDIDAKYRRVEGKWFYASENLDIDLSVTHANDSRLIAFLVRRSMHYSLPEFGTLPDKERLAAGGEVIRSKTIQGDERYWRSVRPYPLSLREQGIYNMVDRIQNGRFYKWTYGILYTLISGYVQLPGGKVELGRWARTFSSNEMEGFRVSLGGRTRHTFSTKVRLGGYLAYGFKDKKPKGQARVEWMIGRELTRKLTVTYKEDYEWLGSGSGVFSAPNMFSSILMRSDGNKQTFVRTADILYQHEFNPSFNAELQWTSQRMWSNPTVPIYSVDGTHAVMESMAVHQLSAALRLSIDERVGRGYFKKTYLYSQYPVLLLGVSGAFKGITEGDISYVRTYAALRWRFPSTAIGYGDLNINGGIIWGSVPHTLLKLHKGNTTYYTDKTAFSCMDAYEFASDRWLEGYYEHNFGGFFLGKIPLIKQLDLREVASVRFAWGDLTEQNRLNTLQETKNLNIPYVEAGIGISNILQILRVDFFWRLTQRQEQRSKNFSVNVGLELSF